MFFLLALLIGPGGPASGGSLSDVLEARLEASARGLERSVEARLDVRIHAPAVARLRFRALEIRETRIENLAAFEGDRPLTIRLDLSRRPLVRGEIELPPPTGTRRGMATQRVVTFRYRVDQPDARALTVPSIIVGDGQGAARAGAFSARLLLPDGIEPGESFPANGVVAVEGTSYDWKLPLVPAFVAIGAPAGETVTILEASRGAGFSFWGLFVVSAAVVCLYLMWMIRCERRGQS